MRDARSHLAVCAVVLAAVSTALAAGVGRISGILADQEGKPIAGATVTFKHVQQGFERNVMTDEKGKYLISTLPFGPINITIKKEGFQTIVDDIDWVPAMSPAVRDVTMAKEGAAPVKGQDQGPVIEGLTKELATALDDANEAIAADDWAKAASIYEQVRLSSAGSHPLLLMGLVNAYFKLKNPAKAEETLKVALTLDPVPAGAHFYMGNIHAGAGKKAEALAEFKAETQVSPTNDRAFYNLGAIAYELGKKDEALAALEKAKEINSGNAEASSLLAQIYAEKGDTAKATATGGSDPLTLLNIGITQYTDHKDREALASFQKAAEADPKMAKAQKMLGLTYVRLGDLAKAKVSFRMAVELDGKDEESRQMLKELGE